MSTLPVQVDVQINPPADQKLGLQAESMQENIQPKLKATNQSPKRKHSLSTEAHEAHETNTTLRKLFRSLSDVDSAETTEAKVNDYVPFPYRLTNEGIFRESKEGERSFGKTEQICSPLIIRHLTRSATGKEYGLDLGALTLDGKIIEMAIPAKQLHGDPALLANFLEDHGVRVIPSKEKALSAYLDAARTCARRRPWMTAMPRTGWSDGDKMTYVLPDKVIGSNNCVYQPEHANKMKESCKSSGTLIDWQNHIVTSIYHSDLLLFMVCASFTGPLLRPANSDSFGFNLAGMTSRGKTTALQIAASVWGCGSDPGADSNAMVRRWNSTANALEAMAEEHCDLPLCLDELGQFRNASELDKAIYSLAGGRGAERLKSDSSRRTVREWRSVFLSTGEISMAELMAQHGKQQKGGQALRILDIPFPVVDLFDKDIDAGKTVRHLKEACGNYYGTAGRAFTEWLVQKYATHARAHNNIRSRMKEISDLMNSGEAPEILRALDRFALVQTAGELAIEAGILHCTPERIATAMRAVWEMWRAAVPDVDDGRRAIKLIAQYIYAHPGHFPDSSIYKNLPLTISGYLKIKAEGALYLFNDDGFKAAIGDISKTAALHALENSGLIYKNEANRTKSKHKVSAVDTRTYFYAIRASIFDEAPLSRPIVSVAESAARQPRTSANQDNASAASLPHAFEDDVEF
ncbi:DUF927 domain-containing protein [Herbaspirillum sp. RTI4]|uniref:DUF927 domain-containing protein n=1 Tax=Herbaspirillum sp. RTI4 TaxID=3048640 RepID=UPI002AB57E33|nr:DUF927 domain-containing protein [Herbaspirillum sp. RTI4]MDY7580079.1 DUF927 domain-containing protein [Herbaspirillum sp. RTI4]MEA9983306.1 DUF927 domain-containing protein [Herbaspirillum sp. RTI4]